MGDKDTRRHHWFRNLPWSMILLAAVLLGLGMAYACTKGIW